MLNPKSGQGDGAGFGRLRKAQAERDEFKRICQMSHPSCEIYVDQVREYAGSTIVFYRALCVGRFEQARIAVFKFNSKWVKENDIIAAIAD